MSANAHTAVMTDLEQRIQDGRQLSAPRPRINRIMEDRFYGRKPRVDIQRAVLFTQSMMQTEAYPQVLRTALAIQYMMEHIEVVIQPHELIVGTAGGPGRYCVLYPETRGGQFPRDLPKILKAEGKAGYAMTQAEVDTVLNEVVPYWKGKTSHELYLNMLPRETRRVIYGDEEYATQGLIFDEANNAHTLSWTGSYEKVIREGLESIIRELEERKAGIEGNLLHNQMDKIYYLDAAILSCKAMITYAHRYADRAEAMAAEESDPVRRAELETIAEICRHVPEHPARNFYEAVQAQWFLQVGYRLENMNGGGVGLGRLDQYLYPLYKAGLEDGTLTEERAMEILECMFIKVGEVVPYQGKSTAGGHEGYTHFEALSLGGLTPDGRDATNPLGLESIIRELEERKAGIEGNLLHNQMDKIYYLDAAILSCKAMITYAHRYADRAEAMAAEESDPVRRAELETIAEICRHVPEHPARNFYEAVQAQWFLQVGYRLENMNGGGVGLGRLDQYLYPLYKAGLEDGTLTEERAMEILECMFIKVGEVVPYQGKSTAGGHEGYTHFEALSLGGLTPDGRDATNPLTYLILRSKKEFPFQYPDVSLRVHANTPDKLLRAAAEVVKVGYGCPKFFNDEEFITHYIAAGVPLHIARDYAACGCCGGRLPDYETYLAAVCNLNITAVLEMAMSDGWVHFGDGKYEKFLDTPIPAGQIQNMDDLMVNLEAAFTFFVRHIMKRTGTLEQSNALKLACPFTSALSEAGRINMKDLHQPCDRDYGLYIDNGAVNVIGIGTLIESLSALDEFVFRGREFTLEQVRQAVNANFEGYEPMRQKLLRAPKFANGDQHALELARRFDAMMQNVIVRHRTMHGGQKHLKFVPVASHVALGGKTIATPNGRRAGVALSEGISPTQGTDENGPITTLNAVAAINSHAHDLTMQRLLNIKLSPAFLEGESGIQNFIQIIRTFVDLKLWHIQFNVVNRETLLAAQKDPDKYRNLVVRVAGYCAYFTDLSEKLQTEIINRTEHTSMCTE